MLRTNLATRPFYNERPIHLAIAVFAVLVAALTVWNAVRVMTLSRANTELSTRINRDLAEAEQLTKMAGDIRRRIDEGELRRVVDAAKEANSLIDQRMFSWTAFFNRIETTMPADVMLTSVRPAVREGATRVTMIVLGRRAEDVDEFIEKLEATGAFEDLLTTQQDRTEDGLYRAVVDSVYTGETAAAEPEPAKPDTPAQPAAPQTPVRKTGGEL